MKCKLCDRDLIDIINRLYFCGPEENKTHTYSFSLSENNAITEEYRILDIQNNLGYIIWIDHEDKQTHLKIVQGQKVLQFKVLKDTVIELDSLTEEFILDKINKLMVLF